MDIEDIEFIEECRRCLGTGKDLGTSGGDVCWQCRGRGRTLTPLGRKLTSALREIGVDHTAGNRWDN